MSSSTSADGFFRRFWRTLKKTFAKAKVNVPEEVEVPPEGEVQDDGMIHRLLKGANIGSRNRKYSIALVNETRESKDSLWDKLIDLLKKIGAKKEPPPPPPRPRSPRLRNDSVRSERLVDFQRLPNIGEYVY